MLIFDIMAKIHPANSKICRSLTTGSLCGPTDRPVVWTVWKKSSMTFQGTDGFSVYDANGQLAFRVDNYSRKAKYLAGEVELLDGKGKALITLKPQILSMHDRWNGFASENTSPLFTMRRRSLFQSNDEAEVYMGSTINQTSTPDFWVDGSFTRRCCKIWSRTGKVAAVINRKKVNNSVVLEDDVFSLTVNPCFNSALIMAFIVVMDRMFQKTFPHFLCP